MQIGAETLNRILQNQLNTPAIDISATDIRNRVSRGLCIRYLTAKRVVEYIARHRLYQ